jgi:hypothetical protein
VMGCRQQPSMQERPTFTYITSSELLAPELCAIRREHRRAQATRRFVMGRADLGAYYQARVAGMSDFRKKLRTVRRMARSSRASYCSELI